MRDSTQLRNLLHQLDGKGYKAYKDIRGEYRFDRFALYIDYVQGDPFAPPSKLRAAVLGKEAGFPPELIDTPAKRIAAADFLTRVFHNNIEKFYERVGGTGKSGLLAIDRCGQEILERTSVAIDNAKIEARFEAGLPAAGRRILGNSAIFMFFDAIPRIVENSLYYKNIDTVSLKRQVELAVDQEFLRKELVQRRMVAFVADGSILPRESGTSDKPMRKGAVYFKSPDGLKTEIMLPNKGKITGMGIPEGVTLIVGGGYHGKSTLLKALERGVYNHIAGDGREFVITRDNAVKIRAEDGRRVEKVDISPFINNLPNNEDTSAFSSDNASGSTSQAANIIEALEAGTELLLIDEDTSATNFMIRDERMRRLIPEDREPITPFIDRVRQLYTQRGVSTVMVIGGCGDYFDVADRVIMMDAYVPKDVTASAMRIAEEYSLKSKDAGSKSAGGDCFVDGSFSRIRPRTILKTSFAEGKRGIEVKAKGLHTVLYNKQAINLSFVEQLVDTSQTNCLAVMLEYLANYLADKELTVEKAADMLYERVRRLGLDSLSPYTGHPGNLALPRKQEFCAMLNRFVRLKAAVR